MKSNDNIPHDEMLLAEAIAAARARGLEWCAGQRFMPDSARPEIAKSCCAMGALQLAGALGECTPTELMDVWRGNDDVYSYDWGIGPDNGESLGWAFRCAMTEES